MTIFKVRVGTPWRPVLVLGQPGDGWRADDYEHALDLKQPGSGIEGASLLRLTTADGGIIVTDPVARRVELNAEQGDLATLTGTLFDWDILSTNKTTGVRMRSETHQLEILGGVTTEGEP